MALTKTRGRRRGRRYAAQTASTEWQQGDLLSILDDIGTEPPKQTPPAPAKAEGPTKPADGMDAAIRPWYTKTFPDDEMGAEISGTVTFRQIVESFPVRSGAGELYSILGAGDSTVRERIFDEISERSGMPRDDIYKAWTEHQTLRESAAPTPQTAAPAIGTHTEEQAEGQTARLRELADLLGDRRPAWFTDEWIEKAGTDTVGNENTEDREGTRNGNERNAVEGRGASEEVRGESQTDAREAEGTPGALDARGTALPDDHAGLRARHQEDAPDLAPGEPAAGDARDDDGERAGGSPGPDRGTDAGDGSKNHGKPDRATAPRQDGGRDGRAPGDNGERQTQRRDPGAEGRDEHGDRGDRGERLKALDLQRADSPRRRAEANIVALKTLNELRGRESEATPEQIEALRGFSGWGGCADAFSGKPEWKTINDELRGLLDADQYAQARGSVLTAFYTPGATVGAMWDALATQCPDAAKAGGAWVIEPGCGTGNFLGTRPETGEWHMTGVELDPISAQIAAILNPQADVVNGDFTRCSVSEGSWDAAIGNVPYSADITFDYRLLDGRVQSLPIHDWFIERSVDALRPGGTAILLTSRHTMDKRGESVRADIARKAELVGMVRLPAGTFDRQSNTRVVTDVLVLRKRGKALDRTPDESWIHSDAIEIPGSAGPDGRPVTVNVNRLVAEDPDGHVAGTLKPTIGRFGGDIDVSADGDERATAERLSGLLTAQLSRAGRPSPGKRQADPACALRPEGIELYSYQVDRHGVVWYGDGETVEQVAAGNGKEARRLRGMIALRDLVRGIQTLELDPAHQDENDPELEGKRRALNEAYDSFAAEFGRLCTQTNRRAYRSEESGWHLIQALEDLDASGRFKAKAAIFERRTLAPEPPMPEHAENMKDALGISLDRTGKVDTELIGKLTDTPAEQVEGELGDLVIRDPDTDELMPAEDYLTGDVVAKAAHLRGMAEDLRTRDERTEAENWASLNHGMPGAIDPPTVDKTDEWIAKAGDVGWKSLSSPLTADSYISPVAAAQKPYGKTTWQGLRHDPEMVMDLATRALTETPEGGRADTTAMIWRFAFKGSGAADAAIASGTATIGQTTEFIARIAHDPRIDENERTRLFQLLFSSMTVGSWGGKYQADAPVASALRILIPDKAGDKEALARELATDPSISEYLLAAVRESGSRGKQQNLFAGHGDIFLDSIKASRDGWLDYRARRGDHMREWAEANAEPIARAASEADRLDRIADRLDQVRPTPLGPEQISAELGSPWIPAKDVFDFMAETFGLNAAGLTQAKAREFQLNWIPQLGQWRVDYPSAKDLPYRTRKAYGTEDLNPCQILEHCLNNAQIKVTKKVIGPDGREKSVTDQRGTMEAMAKADALRSAFRQWVFRDDGRRQRLTALYNARFNNLHPRHVDGAYVTTPGIVNGIQLRPHQKDAVARALRSEEGTLIAHVVGAGKTFEGVAITHEAKRLGKASKPMLVVPNHLVDQWAGDYAKLYPTDRIIVMDKDAQRNPQSVRRFWGRVMTGDWDAVIVPESRFTRLHVTIDRRIAGMERRVDEFVDAIREREREHGKKDATVKRLEAARKKIEEKMRKLREAKEKRDDSTLGGITFEQLGIDMLFVDEAHKFKNLGIPVAGADLGMGVESSAKSEDLLDKCEWMREAGHGGNIVFATGTPVSNSMSELYNMQRYLAPGTLKAQGLDTFAAWAGTYGQVVPTVELKPEGDGFQVKQRFAKFQNLPEMMGAVKQFTDMITNDDIDLDLPELESVPVAVPATESQRDEMEKLAERADRVRSGSVPPDEDNLLRITSDGRKIALDPKLLKDDIDREPLSDGGKVQRCAENVARIWRQESERKGAQLVFCDTSTPASGGWNVYQDLKDRLIEQGVPEEQIAFIHDAGSNPEKREQLFEKVRNGEIRVLVGSTEKLGTGTNVQERLCAIHDLDCPWRPADLEQRLGRVLRQGNMYRKVYDFRYVTEGTFDAYSYQTVERKQRFISQLMSSKSPAREASDLDDDVVSLAAVKALATGDPDIQKRMNLENELNQMTLLRAAHGQQRADARRDAGILAPIVESLARIDAEETEDRPAAERAREIRSRGQQAGHWEGITVEGRTITDRGAANAALAAAARRAADGAEIAEYDGLAVCVHKGEATGTVTLSVRAAHDHEAKSPMPDGAAAGSAGITAQLDRLIKGLAEGTDTRQRLEKARAELNASRETAETPWPREAEYAAKKAELERLKREQDGKKRKTPPKAETHHGPQTPRQEGPEGHPAKGNPEQHRNPHRGPRL